MTPDDTRNFFQQEDDAWSRAIELALTPVVAAGIGYVIDRVVGTVPIFTIVFLVLAVIGTFVKMYYAYDTKMKAHDAESPWGRAQIRGAARTAERAAAQRAAAAAAGKAPKRTRDAAADHAAANRAAADHAATGARAKTARPGLPVSSYAGAARSIIAGLSAGSPAPADHSASKPAADTAAGPTADQPSAAADQGSNRS
jgi:F0F1-type ATP synthase assembly protein I